jgi:NAD(P)-dependent dehydrogenase (short-subunit alcohol dehydrogenase family)
MMQRLAGKVAVVTGAGSGIGRAAARAFAAEGAVVGLLDRNGPAVEALARELGDSGFALTADVSSEVEVERAFAEVDRRAGRLEVLYNCAGVELYKQDRRAHELDLAIWEKTLAINLTGMFLTCKYGLRLMLRGGGGSVINCGSPTAITGCGAGSEAYSASKGGVMAFTRVLAIDYARDGIRVNSIVPGTIDTPMNAAPLAEPGGLEAMIAGEPIGRLGTAEDLVGIAVYLASDESRFATGGSFFVDGGLCIR